jgi:murein DD-endopeptidase MepM/ murein hydrolase activator NlpD
VILSGWDGGYGNAVRIDHGNGLVTVYGHNSKLFVKVGDIVKAGDLISAAGNTGHSFGTHLHLEIRVNDVPQNPITFFKERGVDFFLETESVYGTG